VRSGGVGEREFAARKGLNFRSQFTFDEVGEESD
jgi:hypothetical protein